MHVRFVTGIGLAFLAAVAQGANVVLKGPVGFAGVAGKGKVVVSVDIPETDVTPYDRMLVDVVNEGPEEDEVNVHLATADMKPDTGPYIGAGMRQRHWAPVGRSTWTVDLRKWYGTGDPKKIAKLHFFCYRPFGSTMRLSRVRFLKSQEEDVPSLRDPAEEARLADLAKAAASRREAAHREAFDSFRRSCAAIGLPTDRMLVGTATAMDQIRPMRPESFARVSPARDVAVRLAKDEYESFQVLVTPVGAALKNVSVSLDGDLEGECGTFAASNVACCVTGYVKTRGVASYTVGETIGDSSAEGGYRRVIANPVPGWWADPILSFQRTAEVSPGVLQSFWVRVKCPRRQAAGTYRGGLVVSSDGVPSLRIPLSVRVNSFAVPRDSQLPLAITFGPSLNKYFETSVEAEVYEHIVKDSESPYNAWRRHREEWSDFLADYLLSVDNLYYTEIKPNRDFDLRARQVARRHRSWTNLGYWGEAGEGEKYEKYFNETLLPLYRSAYDEAKRIGLGDRAYLYGADEIGPDKFERAAKTVRRLKEALPGVPVMTTARDGKYGVGNALSCVDIFVPLTRWYDPVQADKARAEGRKVYWYIADGPENGWANCNIENPVGDLRLLMGAQTVRMRPDGFLFWQVSRWASPRPITSGPFTDWETRTWILWNGQGYWTTVGPDGVPLPTLRLENFRDGLEDYAYAVLLRHKLKTATDAGWIAKANELLSVPTSVMKKMDDYSDLPAPVYAWRDAMADLLEAGDADPAARVRRVGDGVCTVGEIVTGAVLRVDFRLSPEPGSDIRCRIELPSAARWDGRMWGVGNSGWAGSFLPISQFSAWGTAVVTTDLGTAAYTENGKSNEKVWPDCVRRDYDWRATHLMTVYAKRIVEAYYGRPPSRCYFDGGSCGGRQGIGEAIRFPEDYDGVIAHMPGNNPICNEVDDFILWKLTHDEAGKLLFTEDEMHAVSDAAVAYGASRTERPFSGKVLADPFFTADDVDGFLSLAAEKAPRLADPDLRSRLRRLFLGTEHRGRRMTYGKIPGSYLVDEMRRTWHAYFPQFLRSRGLTRATATLDDLDEFVRLYAPTYNACSDDLEAFRRRGGKLIVTPGLEDQTDPPRVQIAHFERVVSRLGGDLSAALSFYRVFPVPGCAHGGGRGRVITIPPDGPAVWRQMIDWREKDVAPERFMVPWKDEGVDIPVAPYPKRLVQDDRGNWIERTFDRSRMPSVDPFYLQCRTRLP